MKRIVGNTELNPTSKTNLIEKIYTGFFFNEEQLNKEIEKEKEKERAKRREKFKADHNYIGDLYR